MRGQIIELAELTESREMLRAREPNFIAVFIWIVLFLLVVAFFWMWFCEIDIVVKATGIVRPGGNVSIVRSIYGGELKEVFYREGATVKKGELLLIIETSLLEQEKDYLFQEKNRLEKEAENLWIMEKSIREEKNLFYEEELHYYNWYLSYKYGYEQLHLHYMKAKNRYLREKNLGSGATSAISLEELHTEYLLAEINRDRYRSEMLVELKERMESNRVQLLNVTRQLKEVEEKIKMHRVTAPISGVVQVLQSFNPGDYLPAGVEILRIIPAQGTGMKVEMMVENKDIGQLALGQKVDYRFLALPHQEYGTLSGKIINIAGDIQMINPSGEAVYLVEGSIDGGQLMDKKGRTAEIKVGMLCEARIVVKQRKILYYLLEKLDFLS